MANAMNSECESGATSPAGWATKRRGWLCGLACLSVLVLVVGAGLRRGHAQQASFSLPAIDPPNTTAQPASKPNETNQPQAPENQQPASFSLPAIDPPKTASTPAPKANESSRQQAAADQPPTMATAPGAPQLEVARECADLLKMATDLKAAVDKTNQDTLSVTVVRKADQIEQYARKVRLGSGKS
jgi:phage-related tail fiber protein